MTNTPPTFDPNAAASVEGAIFGLPFAREQSGVVLVPVPFDATTSYRPGTRRGPEAIRVASAQVDLFDHRFGNIYERGIFMEPHDEEVEQWSIDARELAEPLIAKGGAEDSDLAVLEKIEAYGSRIRERVRGRVERILSEGRVPGLIGGEHSVPLGAIEACCDRFGSVGVLQVDAHMDLREAFEGFRFSHASIMFNVLEMVPGVERIVQVGIRDTCEAERAVAAQAGSRVRTWYWEDMADRLDLGQSMRSIVREAIAALPEHVYLTFDIDGLDPSLCPHTGTPVPGGLSFDHASMLLSELKASGRTVVGFDLVEVAPGDDTEWDANVGARLLYRMCGLAGAR